MTGVAGYIAPRHLKAIKETGNQLVAASDPHDAVGILDSYFPNAKYFRESAAFEQYLKTPGVDYLTICSPNFLHLPHVRAGLEGGAHVICEKPLVLSASELDEVQVLERSSGKRVSSILQLRLHPRLRELKRSLKPGRTKRDVQLTYVTPRGQWYLDSWKGDVAKSGGLATNIGIHLFDLVLWLFGGVKQCALERASPRRASGALELEGANVYWFLSIDRGDIPKGIQKPSYRLLTIDGEPLEFSDGFTDLHTESYREILAGRGFGTEDVRPSIELAERLRELAETAHE